MNCLSKDLLLYANNALTAVGGSIIIYCVLKFYVRIMSFLKLLVIRTK